MFSFEQKQFIQQAIKSELQDTCEKLAGALSIEPKYDPIDSIRVCRCGYSDASPVTHVKMPPLGSAIPPLFSAGKCPRCETAPGLQADLVRISVKDIIHHMLAVKE